MKILVLSNIRCGGEYFTKSLSETYKLKHIHEPTKIVDFGNDVCVKIHVYNITSINYIIEYSKSFDYVFLLDRLDINNQLKSAHVTYNITNHRTAKWKWNDSYMINNINKINLTELENRINDMSNTLRIISKRLNKEIIYYEDLYYNTKIVDLNNLKFNPDLSKRYYMGEFNKSKLI